MNRDVLENATRSLANFTGGIPAGTRPQASLATIMEESSNGSMFEEHQQVLRQIVVSNIQKLKSESKSTTGSHSDLPCLTSRGSGSQRFGTIPSEEALVTSSQQELPAQPNFQAMHGGEVGANQNPVDAHPRHPRVVTFESAEDTFRKGAMFSNGFFGQDPDPYESYYLYRQAAEQGHPAAQTRLGYKHIFGSGVNQDFKAAVKWLQQAAEQDHAQAAFMLGIMHQNRLGVGRDYKTARHWYTVAANQKHAGAQFHLGAMVSNGLGGGTPDPHASVSLYTEAAKQGYPAAQCRLGDKYTSGSGVEHNSEAAVKWYRLAAEKGDSEAQYSLAMHRCGKDDDLKWLTLAANQYHVAAISVLSGRYENGIGVAQDYEAARKWRARMDDLGLGKRLFLLGERYEKHSHDLTAALCYYTRAANLGTREAIRRLQLEHLQY